MCWASYPRPTSPTIRSSTKTAGSHPGAGISEETISVAEQSADFGADLTFGINGTEFGVEICEDLWTAIPPSSHLALNGAKVIFNLSASPESVGKHAYLRQLVAQQSARTLAGYVYCSAGFGESSTDLVFAGNGIVAENGRILRESERFRLEEQLVVADIDIQRLEFERRRNTSFRMHEGAAENTVIEMEVPEGLRGRGARPRHRPDAVRAAGRSAPAANAARRFSRYSRTGWPKGWCTPAAKRP